jgi:periplasmic protein TonB
LTPNVLLKVPTSSIALNVQPIDTSTKLFELCLKSKLVPRLIALSKIQLKQSKQIELLGLANIRWQGWSLTLVGHGVLIALLAYKQVNTEQVIKRSEPMMVSIVASPTPEIKHHVVPIVKPVKVNKMPVKKTKKRLEKIIPIENPIQPIIEAVTEAVEEKMNQQETAVTSVESSIVESKVAIKDEKIVEEIIEPPKFGVSYLHNPAPDYPRLARRLGEEGRVLLKVLVSDDGSAASVNLEKSSGSERLDNAAMDTVKQWRFIPARKGGVALSAYVLVPIMYSLDQ